MFDLLAEMLAALGVDSAPDVRVEGHGTLPSAFRVSDLATASIAAAGVCLDTLMRPGGSGEVVVDRALAAQWFAMTIRPVGWQLPTLWDAVAGDYPTGDGWIRLHTNAPHHRRAAMDVLATSEDREAVASAVRGWAADELETAIVAAGGAAAAMRTVDAWGRHPQGIAVNAEPLVAFDVTEAANALALPGDRGDRPLRDVRVLDLTRVLAGPIATRLLAGWGADVLRVDPPHWDEPGVIPEVMPGKRSTRLDLADAHDRSVFAGLLAQADVLVHGYRSDALERLGFGAAERAALRPGLVDVALDAYGWTGPWSTRRGFDSLVQMSSGIAAAGMARYGRDRPTPLPVQALDHATGYLMATAALRGLAIRRGAQRGSRWRLSLGRTARLLVDAGPGDLDGADLDELMLAPDIEATSWGSAQRVASPLRVIGAPVRWDRPARALGADDATWQQ